jgi:hypothetical protein
MRTVLPLALRVLLVLLLLLPVMTARRAEAHPPYGIAADREGGVWFLDAPSRRLLRMDVGGKTRVVIDFTALGGLTEIPLDTAEAISRWKRKFLPLEGIRVVSPEVRALVERGCEAVSWRGLAPPR